MVRIHRHATCRVISPMLSEENAQKHQFWPVSLSKIGAKRRKSTDHDHDLISSAVGQNTSALQIAGHFYHAFSRNCLKPPRADGEIDGGTRRPQNIQGCSNGPKDGRTIRKHNTSGAGRQRHKNEIFEYAYMYFMPICHTPFSQLKLKIFIW